MNKKIIFFVTVVSFFMILNFSKIALAEDCGASVDNIHNIIVTCSNVDYNVSFLACGYIGNDYAGTFTVSTGSVSETFQLLVNQSRTLSNGASFKLNSVLCSANQTIHPSAASFIITSAPTSNVTCTDSDGGINYYTKGNVTVCNFTSQGGGCGIALDSCSGSALTEGYCDSNQAKSITYPCPYGCSDGACLSPPQNMTCSDSDGGKNYYVNGAVTKGNVFSADCCAVNLYDTSCVTSSFFINERYCDASGNINTEDVQCPVGYYCKNGACANQPYCYDSDNGTNYYVKGYVDSSMAPGKAWDTCVNSTLLDEYQCNPYVEGANLGTNYNCPYGCSDGACLKSPQNVTCIDSDGGRNYYVKGSILTNYNVKGSASGFVNLTDSCYLMNPDGSGVGTSECSSTDSRCKLFENWCGDNQIPMSEDYTCPYGCKNGACLSEPLKCVASASLGGDSCTDSDGGKNYFVKGYSHVSFATGVVFDRQDSCNPSGLDSSVLREWCCLTDGTTTFEDYTCPNGCANGACIAQPTNNVTTSCVNHDECSQACDNLSISSHWMGSGSYRRTWEGTCPSGVYGCMTGDCCLGQCPSSGDCLCLRTNVVDIYGNVCPTGSTCGQDCSCHPTGGTGGGYVFSVKTDKYSYSPGDEMKITATLLGYSSMDFSGYVVTATVAGTNITMNPIGTGTSACTASATGTTCSVSTNYYFVGTYEVPSDMTSGVYNVLSTAILNGDRKDAIAKFQVGNNYKDYVDVSISPHEQNTIIGNEVDYYVTIIDKHPAMACPAIVGSNCTSQSYDYIIDVEGLPYHTVVPSDVNVYAGGLKTFELKVFPSSVKTSEGIIATAQSTNATSSERSVGITGKVVATQTSSETVPVQEALFKFAVKAYLKEDATVSHSDAGILHVKFVQTPQPTPFPNTEKMNVELRKGWNLISLSGKGSGFIQGSCSADQKPIAFVYLPDKQTFASMEEAISAMGNGELLNHLSTHSFWVYSYEDCNVGFNVDSYSTYSGLAVDSGWNLLGITKDMVGETLSNIKGDCVFEKIYNWDSSSQKWIQMSENDLIDKMGYGIAVKASAACIFKANFIQPPTFPGG